MAYWLVKTEPDECGIEDFAIEQSKPIPWDGVRNYQARNFLRQMAEGDKVIIYHSSCKNIGAAGVVRVVRAAYPDPTQFDPGSPYHDPKSDPEAPRWLAVDLVYERTFAHLIPLAHLKAEAALAELALVRKGNRLSVMPVTTNQFEAIERMAG